jgi:pimeloyl-ACP methyl ester carboxylesterase
MNRLSVCFAIATALAAGCATVPPPGDRLVTTDHLVPHVSTVPANAGQNIGLFVRQKVASSVLEGQRSMNGRVVLFVHGATVPAVPDYDLEHKTYNWMAHLARAGFNVYAMDQSGYGGSPRPMMDDACNLDPKSRRS